MLKRPNFCCSCGEKIDRIEWHLWTSRRFCELCQVEHQVDEWLPRIIGGFLFLVGMFGIGASLDGRNGSADLTFAPSRLASDRAEERAKTTGAEKENRTLPVLADADRRVADPKTAEGRPAGPGPGPAKPDTAEEPAVFCGALTKKGTPCTRKVKGGGRCWQHIAKEAPDRGPGGEAGK